MVSDSEKDQITENDQKKKQNISVSEQLAQEVKMQESIPNTAQNQPVPPIISPTTNTPPLEAPIPNTSLPLVNNLALTTSPAPTGASMPNANPTTTEALAPTADTASTGAPIPNTSLSPINTQTPTTISSLATTATSTTTISPTGAPMSTTTTPPTGTPISATITPPTGTPMPTTGAQPSMPAVQPVEEKEERNKELEFLLETALFALGRPLRIDELAKITEYDEKEVRSSVKRVRARLKRRNYAFRITEIANDVFLMSINENLEADIEHILTGESIKKFSNTDIEVLTNVAYRQPVKQTALMKMLEEGYKQTDLKAAMDRMKAASYIEEYNEKTTVFLRTTRKFAMEFGFSDDLKRLKLQLYWRLKRQGNPNLAATHMPEESGKEE